MPQLIIDYQVGPVAIKLGQIAQAAFVARHANDVPVPATPAPAGAMKEMLRDYLRDVYQQSKINEATAAAQAAITAAGVQASVDGASIT